MTSVLLPLVALLADPRVESTAGVRKVDFNWTNEGAPIAGTLYLPEGNGPHPAAVLIHGSGRMGRGQRGSELLESHAERLAEAGVAVLFYDKRGVGKSGGDWRQASFELLAADAAAGVERLRQHPSIDASRIGYIGLSQGGWVSVLTAERTGDPAFFVMLSGTALTPADQERFVVDSRLARAGFSVEARAAARQLVDQVFQTFRTDSGWEALAEAAARAANEPWFETAQIGIATREDAWWRWYASFMDYDSAPALARMRAPVLAVFNDDDQLVPPEASAQSFIRAAGDRVTVVRYPGGHGFRTGRQIDVPGAYWSTLLGFLRSTLRMQ